MKSTGMKFRAGMFCAFACLSIASSAYATDPSNTLTGGGAGAVLTTTGTGTSDTATGYNAMNKTTSGSDDTGTGRGALFYNTTGAGNTATGSGAMYHNTTGALNTGTGFQALSANTTGFNNVADGYQTLYSNTSGAVNVAVGYQALAWTTGASRNVAVGAYAARGVSSGEDNTAVGYYTLGASNGTWNSALGSNAMYSASGSECTAIGYNALSYTVGDGNTAIGTNALANFASGSNNTAIGYNAGPTVSGLTNTVALGYNVVPTASNTVVLGNSSMVHVGGYGDWYNYSDARFKTNVKEDVPGLSFITKLRPVTFNWDLKKMDAFDGVKAADPKSEAEKEKKRFTGFLAQEVEQAAQSVNYDFSGLSKPENEHSKYMLSYADLVVPLVKAVQEQQREIDELKKERASAQRASMFGGSATLLSTLAALVFLRRSKQKNEPEEVDRA